MMINSFDVPSFDRYDLTTIARYQTERSLFQIMKAFCDPAIVGDDLADLYYVEEYYVPDDFDFENEQNFTFTRVKRAVMLDNLWEAMLTVTSLMEEHLMGR